MSPSPSSPFQTLHQLTIAVKCEFVSPPCSIWSGLLLISNLISYHNIPNLASAFHHIERLQFINMWVFTLPQVPCACSSLWPEMSLLLPQPNPHTVQLTLDNTGLNCMSPLSWRIFQQQILQYYTFLVCWVHRCRRSMDTEADYKVNANEPLRYSKSQL